MAFFVLISLVIYNSFTCLLGSESMQNENRYELDISPSTVTEGHHFGLYEVYDTLNLTCTFSDRGNETEAYMEWIMPSRIYDRKIYIVHHLSDNFINLVIENLTESDSGEYICKAYFDNIKSLERSIGINVKNKKGGCSEAMFQCSLGMCIPKRYACDGLKDCRHGEDESPNHCGKENPCDNKLRCPDERCIPYTWCCESGRERNCTAKVKHSCCTHMEKLTRHVDSDLGFQYEQHKFNDEGFLRTTIYTFIGAIAFLFIALVIVVAISRVHMRISLLTRCPTASRNANAVRAATLHGQHVNRLPLYDLDLYLNRSGCNNDLMPANPLLVTYGNGGGGGGGGGVQFVGRPIDPPPYCKTMTSPPREGPPPPYASRENLCHIGRGTNFADSCEPFESDALLDRNSISVISSNAMDVAARPPEFVVHVADDADAREEPTDPISKEDDGSDSSHCRDSVSGGGDSSTNHALTKLVSRSHESNADS